MATNAYYLNQFISTTLSTAGGIDDSQTTGIKIASTSGVTTDKPGILCLSYSDPIDTTKAEWISYTSIDVSNELQGVTRGEEGFSAKAHSNGVTVAFPISRSHINNLNDALIIGGAETNMVSGTIDDDTMATASATTLATSESTKAYVDNNGLANGWTPANETWAYASASTFTVASDVTSKYQKGDKIKFTQATDGVKYMYIVGVSESGGTTTVTVTGGSDYDLDNEPITANYYSKVENPQGFPTWFNWTPTFTGFSTDPSDCVFRFKVDANMCTWVGGCNTVGTSNSSQTKITVPFGTITTINRTYGEQRILDNGTATTGGWEARINESEIRFTKNLSNAGFTASGDKNIYNSLPGWYYY